MRVSTIRGMAPVALKTVGVQHGQAFRPLAMACRGVVVVLLCFTVGCPPREAPGRSAVHKQGSPANNAQVAAVDLGCFTECIRRFANADRMKLKIRTGLGGWFPAEQECSLRRSGMYRSTTTAWGAEFTMVSDGTKSWAIIAAAHEYFDMPVTSSLGPIADWFRDAPAIQSGSHPTAAALANAELIGNRKLDGEACTVLKITTPQQYYGTVQVWLSEKSKLPVRIELISANGTTVEDIVALDLNPTFDDAMFTFKPPVDWTKIDTGTTSAQAGQPVTMSPDEEQRLQELGYLRVADPADAKKKSEKRAP